MHVKRTKNWEGGHHAHFIKTTHTLINCDILDPQEVIDIGASILLTSVYLYHHQKRQVQTEKTLQPQHYELY